MKAKTLSQIASHLFRSDNKNPLRHKIYTATNKKHPRDSVTLETFFNGEDMQEIAHLMEKLFFTKTVQEWRKVSKLLTKDNKSTLADIINTFTNKAPVSKVISVPFTLGEMEQLDYLGI